MVTLKETPTIFCSISLTTESGSTLEELKERKETEDASKSLEFEYTPGG